MNATKLKKQDRINNVLENWKHQYFRNGEWYDDNKKNIYLNLVAVFEDTANPAAKVIDNIIGNGSWTSFKCDVCNKNKNTLFYFRPNYYDEYENSGLNICKKCLGLKKE